MGARRYTLLDVFTSTRLTGKPARGGPRRRRRARRADARVRARDAAVGDVLRAVAEHGRRRLPQPDLDAVRARSRSPATRRSASRRPSRAPGARAASPTRRRRGPGCSRSTTPSTAASPTSRCSRSRPSSGPSSTPARCSARSGSSEQDAHPELPCQVVSTGLEHVIAPVRDAAALGGVWRGPRSRGRPAHGATGADCACTPRSPPRPEEATARARSFFAARRAGRGPRRPAPRPGRSAPTSPSAPARSASPSPRASRWGARRAWSRPARGRSRAGRRRRGRRAPTAPSSWTPDRIAPPAA